MIEPFRDENQVLKLKDWLPKCDACHKLCDEGTAYQLHCHMEKCNPDKASDYMAMPLEAIAHDTKKRDTALNAETISMIREASKAANFIATRHKHRFVWIRDWYPFLPYCEISTVRPLWAVLFMHGRFNYTNCTWYETVPSYDHVDINGGTIYIHIKTTLCLQVCVVKN
jgi:hypothetical protein